jgi:ABC-type sugar transport system substrate-binding protein
LTKKEEDLLMKKRFLAVLMAATMAFGLAACGGAGGTSSETTGDQAAAGEFNPDKAEDAMTIEEVREANGAEVPVDPNYKFGMVMKSLSNEFWRTLEEG